MPLAQFLAVRRSRSTPQLPLPPLSSSSSTAGRPQHQIFSSSSAIITVARATHLSTSAPLSLHRASGTGGPHQTTYPQMTSHYDDAVRAQAATNTTTTAAAAAEGYDAAAGDDRPRAVLTPEEVMTNYDTSILFSDSPVASALRTPSPASSLLPSSPLDGGSFWDRMGRVDEAREEDRAAAAVDDDGIGSSPPRLRTRGGGMAQAVHYTDPGSPIPAAVDTGEDGEESCLIEKEEAAAVYADVWRNRDRDRGDLPWAKGFQRPQWACPEWASVRRKIDRDELEDLTDSLGEGHDGDQTVIRRSGPGKDGIGSENWERLLRTPSPPVQAPSSLSYDGPPAMADLPAAPTQARKKRITRARRLTADPTPNRLAAAKGTNKHFRQMNRDQARVASPTFQALSAGRLPLSGGFQITIGSERGDDPFPAPVQQPEQEEAADTMDEIDSCLTGIWNLYANGDRQSRLLLLRDLRRTMAVQEARGVRSGPAESED